MTYPEQVKSLLYSDITQMAETPSVFSKNPNKDFTRKRKLEFEKLMKLLISMSSGSTGHELLKYFNYDILTPTTSAFYQQREKLLPEAFLHLIKQFNSHFPFELYKEKYQLVACDGCEFNIARNPNDPSTFHQSNGKSKKGFNMLHTVSFYDLLSKRYLDCIVQNGREKNEFQGFCELVDRHSYPATPIFVGDRGFASYNAFAHVIEKGALFMIRAKDINVKRMLNLSELPDDIDRSVNLILTRSNAKKKRQHPELSEQYRYIASEVSFDYIEPGSTHEYQLQLRIVRFEVVDGIYENIVTNLPVEEFPPDEMKAIYHMRWGIELAFRDLKHTIGAVNFHAKKVKYITQEIWARLILFNFCSVITAHVIIEKKNTKHIYQVNISMAMKICHHFLRLREDEKIPSIKGLIGKYILPIRPGRNYDRRHRFQLPSSFAYRFS